MWTKESRPSRFILIDKTPIPEPDIIKWAEFMESGRFVAQTTLGTLFISTVFLGIDYAFGIGRGPPVLFETMIFQDDPDAKEVHYCMCYTTWNEALRGHDKTVELVKADKVGDAPAVQMVERSESKANKK